MVQPVTFQCGCLSIQRPASDGVLQSIDMYLICGRHLQHTDRQLIFNHWPADWIHPCKYWDKNLCYHEPWDDNAGGVRSNVHLFGGAVDVLGFDDHAVAWQACIGGSPWHSEGGWADIWDRQVGRSRDHCGLGSHQRCAGCASMEGDDFDSVLCSGAKVPQNHSVLVSSGSWKQVPLSIFWAGVQDAIWCHCAVRTVPSDAHGVGVDVSKGQVLGTVHSCRMGGRQGDFLSALSCCF